MISNDRLAAGLRVVVLAVPVLLLLVLGWTHRWNSDDAFINFRVVDQLVHGNGPVFNVGERVEAYTSTLWIAVLAVPATVVGSSHLEWTAVLCGLAMSAVGLGAATWAAARLNRDRPGVMLPLGALVFAVLSPSWDFASSGLETGLGFGWLGLCFLGLVLVYTRAGAREARWRRLEPLDGMALAVGLGPLVRPDFALFTVGFLALTVALSPRPVGRAALRALGFALPLPLAYQLFRMGYFAELVPNTALAKEAGRSDWSRGLEYVWDTVGTYALYLPVAALLAWLVVRARDDVRAGARPDALLRIVPPVMGLAHLLYVAEVGGDFMHGRMVLPGLFAILLPVAAIPVRRRIVDLALGAGVVVWAVVCAVTLRTAYRDTDLPFSNRINDERRLYTLGAINRHPVTLGDYHKHPWELSGEAIDRLADFQPHTITFLRPIPGGPLAGRSGPDIPARAEVHAPLVAPSGNVGMFGYAAGRDVWVVDLRGLADPVAARIKIRRRGVSGHEKVLPTDWVVARFSDAEPSNYGVSAARGALVCGDLRRVLEAVSSEMGPSRFLRNVAFAARSTSLRFDRDPVEARRDLCGGAG